MSRIAKPAKPAQPPKPSAVRRNPADWMHAPAQVAKTRREDVRIEDGEDEVDTDPIVRRHSSAAVAGAQKPAGVPASIFDAARMARPKRRAFAPLDPEAVIFASGAAPALGAALTAKYDRLLERFEPGTWCDLEPAQAKRLRAIAVRRAIGITLRAQPDGRVRAWRTAEPYQPRKGPRPSKGASS